MNTTDINYKEFIKYVYQHFENETTLEVVEDLLFLEEDYNKDSPTSKGKSLVLNRLIFWGKKVSGKEFKYDQKLFKGINVWIADNHKGKSTIFKIIKFALTGRDSIKPDIKSWIDKVLLEFNVGTKAYTCYIDRTGRDNGALYSFTISRFLELEKNQKLDTIEKEKEFEFKTNIQFQEKIQEFFFEQFSFYTLKYTTHNSSKDSTALSTANLSWVTYFKSIYLESKNYEYLFFEEEGKGAQGRKTFEMILGLPLTYAINMLNIQRDRVLEELGKTRLINASRNETSKEKKFEIESRLNDVAKELEYISKEHKVLFDERPLINEYHQIQSKVNEAIKEERQLQESYHREFNKILPLESEIEDLNNDKESIEAEIKKLSKQALDLDLYRDTESFFSNLEIKMCPHCEIEVSVKKQENERENHVCGLCGETPENKKVEESVLIEKVERIKILKDQFTDKLNKIKLLIAKKENSLIGLQKSTEAIHNKVIQLQSLTSNDTRLGEIEDRLEDINKKRGDQKENYELQRKLIQEEAVLKFQLQEIEKESSADSLIQIDGLNLRKAILDVALQGLEKKRSFLNKDILNKLEKLILKEVNAFGLTSIKHISVTEKYDLLLNQNEVSVHFNDLTEGEKLRVKLAFYLSLIQLDIEHNLGRHPRFLIFDSPGSEEMVPKHLHGLADILKKVNLRFKDQLQIFVGSALHEFAQITEKEKVFVKKEDEFVF